MLKGGVMSTVLRRSSEVRWINRAWIFALGASAFSATANAAPFNYGAYLYDDIGAIPNSVFYETPPGGTLDTGIAADSFSSGNVVTRIVTDGQGNITDVIYGQVSSHADLSTGTIGASANCEVLQSCVARADISDRLAFDVSGLTQPVEIDFSASVDGTFGSQTQTNFALVITAAQSANIAYVGYRTSQATDSASSPEIFLTFTNIGTFDVFGPDSFSGSFIIDPTQIVNTSLPYFVNIAMELSGDSNFDFNNTAALDLDSPIPYTSASGVFLTGTITPSVPTPPSLWLFIAGLAALAWTAFHRRRQAAATGLE